MFLLIGSWQYIYSALLLCIEHILQDIYTVEMLMSGTQEQTGIATHKSKDKES